MRAKQRIKVIKIIRRDYGMDYLMENNGCGGACIVNPPLKFAARPETSELELMGASVRIFCMRYIRRLLLLSAEMMTEMIITM